MACQRQDELRNHAVENLTNLMRVTKEQVDCLKANDRKRLLELDKELEIAFGDKERAFGALREHIDQHGC